MPVESTAPATPKTFVATGAILAVNEALSAATAAPCIAVLAVWDRVIAVLAIAKPTCTPCVLYRASSSMLIASTLLPEALSAALAESRARSHSCCSAATANVLASSSARRRRSSVTTTLSATASPAVAAPLVTADAIPKPTPTGGATKRVIAEATPRPAPTVLVLFTATHCPVKCWSIARSLDRVSLRTSCRAFAAATSLCDTTLQCCTG
mmetsp:Transcript_129767/g.229384  ORF Transcript_129767/g.229384 Transcript_129767/m.229384 type:complete len:210 (+) Transcript_129767:374-1003(+)